MKNKKLLKEFRKVIREEYNYLSQKSVVGKQPTPEHHYRELMFSESDDVDMDKSRNLIFRLLTLRDKIKIDINSSSINIYLDINSFKAKQIQAMNDYFSIEILKDIGCILILNDTKVYFRDISLYKDVINKIKETSNILNKENFEFLYEHLMKNTGLARESNLDDILEDKN